MGRERFVPRDPSLFAREIEQNTAVADRRNRALWSRWLSFNCFYLWRPQPSAVARRNAPRCSAVSDGGVTAGGSGNHKKPFW